MKNLLKIIILLIGALFWLSIPVVCTGQVLHKVDKEWKADKIVYITKYKSLADHCVYYTEKQWEAGKGIVYWSSYSWKAEYKVYITDKKWKADEIWYISKNKWGISSAG